ncbi:protein transport protein Sec24A-like isoform X2 [Dreissena polymorpha]|uniref:protein transport protein Sec24A-like isoform X2 n=1 Tax=Dreissena polymorpha TaxID=45954 RepID=UPI002264D8DF|nr:protein transport protein Sec24A-like isoform X2 [Dreissena polymorpha]
MADAHNFNYGWQNTPPGVTGQPQSSAGSTGPAPPFQGSMIKNPQPVANGPNVGQPPQMFQPPPPGVNGMPTASALNQFPQRPPGPGIGFFNGTNAPPSGQFNPPPRAGMPGIQGLPQFRPTVPLQQRPPPPASQSGPMGSPSLGPRPPVPSAFQPPVGSFSQPVSQPQGPPSQRSSRTNSPAVLSQQSLDALEGQFRGTPDQEQLGPGEQQSLPQSQSEPLVTQWQPGLTTGVGFSPASQPNMTAIPRPVGPPSSMQQTPHNVQPPMSAPGQRPGIPPLSGQGMQPQGMSGQTQPGFGPPTSAPNSQPAVFPPAPINQVPGFPPQAMSSTTQGPQIPTQPQVPGFGPTASTKHAGFPPQPQLSTSQVPGFPPQPQLSTSQVAGFPPQPQLSTSQVARFPPQPQLSTSQVAGFPPRPQSSIQRPGFPPTPPSLATQRPEFPPPPQSSANQVPGFPPQPQFPANQRPGFPPQNQFMANQRPGFTPPPQSSANQVSGFPPPPQPSANQVPGYPPPPQSSANQVPGFPPPPQPSVNQVPGYPPPPQSSANQVPGFPPQPQTLTNQRLGYPPPPQTNQQPGFTTTNQQPSFENTASGAQQYGKNVQDYVNKPLTANFNNMSLQGSQCIDLLQQKKLLPPDGVPVPKPAIPNDSRNVNCNPEVFRCTLNCIPQTSALLNKSRLPLGILIHPFKDLSQLPVIQSSVIVRCRSCRTYINPYVQFGDSRKWKCNLCYRVNELPDEFSFDPVTKSYGDPQRRPEVRSATIEFIAPSEYMLRPPQPAVYLYLLDVSFNAIETGYLSMFCETLLEALDRIPGDTRTQLGFIAYDSAVHFFNLAEGLSQPQMLTVSDVDDIFLPCPDDLLVNLNESRSLVMDLLAQLPTLFEKNMDTRSALGAALQAAYKMTSATGGRITVMQTVLPTQGPGALQNREDPTQKSGKDVTSLNPAIDFYKKMALDCSAQQIAVDLFMFNGQYADMASIECVSKFSGGCIYYYPSYHVVRTPHYVEKFEVDLLRYLTRKIGFESVMRVRCTKGISIHTFHGNFFVRSTDLLSLPNVNPDAGFGMQMTIEESLTDVSTMCFQAALLYTSSKGERRIRVHTLCLPVSNQMSEIHASADQQAIVALLAKMAVDRSLSSSMSDAREAIVNASIDILGSYGSSLHASQRSNGLPVNEQLRLIPLYCLALLKSTGFRVTGSVPLDERTHALQQYKTQPVSQLIQMIYPDLYPVHTIMDVKLKKKGSFECADLPLLQLCSANVDRQGAYLLDTGDIMYLYVGSAINEQFCKDILDVPNFAAIREGGIRELPELENDGSERMRTFLASLMDNRPTGAALIIVRDDGKLRLQFFQHFVEDRNDSTISYHEFLQQIQGQIKR